MKKKLLRYTLLGIAVAWGIALMNTQHEEKTTYAPRDYAEIAATGVLRAVVEYNALSYHVQGDTVEGFDYELLHAFARDMGLKVEVTPEMSFEQRLEGIGTGRYDLLATGTAVTSRLKDSLLFTRPLLLDKQVLVQRKAAGTDTDSLHISNQLELAHRHLYVIKGSTALLRLHNLINEIADTIYIEEVEQYGPEQLLALVAGGDIDYAVCDESIARTLHAEFPDLDLDTDIGFTQFHAWGVNKRSTALLDSLNGWLDRFLQTKDYQRLKKKYFK